jgi:hypothetical protein
MSGISQLLNTASRIARAKRINIIRCKRKLGIMRPIQKLTDKSFNNKTSNYNAPYYNIAVNIPTLDASKNMPNAVVNQRNLSNTVTHGIGIFANISTMESVRDEVPATAAAARAQQFREDDKFLEGIDKFKKENIKNKGRALNKDYNELRELVVFKMYKHYYREENLKESYLQDSFIEKLYTNFKNTTDLMHKLKYNPKFTYKCAIKGGRGNHFDMTIYIYDNSELIDSHNIEWKFSEGNEITDIPQYVNITCPSKYFNLNYEEHHYNKYFTKIANLYHIQKPSWDEYKKGVNSAKFLKDEIQKEVTNDKNNNCPRYDVLSSITNISIKEFLELANFDIEAYNSYIEKTQKNKIYLIYSYKKDLFNYTELAIEDQTINTIVDSNYNNNSILAINNSGNMKLKILLRWKNKKGIALPALQAAFMKL